MNAYSKKITVTILSLAFLSFIPTILYPYVLQGPHIIQLMTEKLGQAESLFVSQKVIFYTVKPEPESLIENDSRKAGKEAVNSTDSQPAGLYDEKEATEQPIQSETIQLDESLRYVFSEAFRSDIASNANQRIYVLNEGQTLTVIDGVVAGTAETRYDLYKDLLLYRSREMLSERLWNLGIDVTVSSLGKFEGKLAFVVGAEYPEQTVSQVWIDKETFQPLRMIISGADSTYRTDFLEIRYSGWQKIGKIRYPMQIEFIQDGTTVRAIEVNDYQINPSFSKDVFDIVRLKSEYRQPISTPNRQGETEGLSEVQKTIEEFKKIFE